MGRPVHIVFLLAMALSISSCRHKPPYEGKSVAQLERMLHDPDPIVQVQGAHGLGLYGAEARVAVPALKDALKSEHLQVRQKVAQTLGLIGPDARDAVPDLTNALADREWTVRRNAATALGQIGADAHAAVPSLEKLAKDPDHLVRKAAQEALTKIRGSCERGA